MSRASDAYNQGREDALHGGSYNNPYREHMEYDLWFEYDSGYREGLRLRHAI